LRVRSTRKAGRRATLGAAAWISAALAACGAEERGPSAVPASPPRAPAPAFVGSAACAECHPEATARWAGSHHDLAMQSADETTVLGNFDDMQFTHRGVTSRFFRRDGGFFVNTVGRDGAHADFEVRYTFGVEPLQQYLVEFPGGRLQSLTIAWDTGERRWFHLYPDEPSPPGDALHWTGRYQTWNSMCAACHSTALKKGYDPTRDSFDTSWSDIDVGCEACHGAGSAHLEWARTRPEGAAAGPAESGLPVRFAGRDARNEVETCAPCHSRRHPLGTGPTPALPFLDHFVPATLREGLYHPDGQIQGEVYVYGSFLQSRMYRAGVRCSDCHDPHTLELRASGDALCVRCHQEQPDPRFPGLAAKAYAAPSHHQHPPESEGARCVACHMPATTYMVVDPRRDHGLRVPRPDLSVKLGTPNACTGCHADQPAEWAAQRVVEWFGPRQDEAPHFAEAIAAGRAGAPDADAALVAVTGDPKQPGIVRASALELLRGGDTGTAAALLSATGDRDPLVRATAVDRLDRLPPEARVEAAAPLLRDPIRAVRVAAARVLAGAPAPLLDAAQRHALDAALLEYEQVQGAQAELPSAHLNLGVLHMGRGRRQLAERAYRTALRLDPAFHPASANLAHLYNQMGRNDEAERVLREALAHAPEEGEIHYSLGLVLAEEGRFDEAEQALRRAAALLPGQARVGYNHALALQHLGRSREAETALGAALELDPESPDVVHALVVFHAQRGEWARALPYAERLVELAPQAPEARQLLERIRAELGRTPEAS
jgi:predicted CXXCH cytochrome family protein